MFKKLSFAVILCLFVSTYATSNKNANSFKDQFCTDPRTMRKHNAYTEWADAYSCTRHRCQPGGRNLAIYTVGCKRVEAPESAIECEEVVEDTNMQFPYCCTRLRCLVVVRGEVWTRVLGQPWEVLPAAPWSHMYKMKRPPPGGEPFQPKSADQGPVYELADTPEPAQAHSKVSVRSSNAEDTRRSSAVHPDLVIALTTNEHKNKQKRRPRAESEIEDDNMPDKTQDILSQETYITGSGTSKPIMLPEMNPHMDWQSEDKKKTIEPAGEVVDKDAKYHGDDEEPKRDDHTPQLQTLVDAIGTRMRDIEGVVHRMNQQGDDDDRDDSVEKRIRGELNNSLERDDLVLYSAKKRPSPDSAHYRRFLTRRHGGGGGSKYTHNMAAATHGDLSTELPLYVEDNRLPGYYSDGDNPVRRNDPDKDPVHPIYMAPIDSQSRRKSSRTNQDLSDEREVEKKRKRKSHRRKHSRGKRRRKDDKRRRNKKTKSGETVESSEAVAVY